MQIQYYCEEDELHELLGTYGQSINENTTIDLNDLKISGSRINLQLKANVQESNKKDVKADPGQSAEQ